MPAGDDQSMSALWNTFRLVSLSPTTREENWPFISSVRWAHAPPCCSPGTVKQQDYSHQQPSPSYIFLSFSLPEKQTHTMHVCASVLIVRGYSHKYTLCSLSEIHVLHSKAEKKIIQKHCLSPFHPGQMTFPRRDSTTGPL